MNVVLKISSYDTFDCIIITVAETAKETEETTCLPQECIDPHQVTKF